VTLVAGVDSSTQNCKVVVVDAATGATVREGRAPHPGGGEVDPEEWLRALEFAIAQAGGLDDVAAMSIGAQQHGMVVLDNEGRVIRPALLWNDTRSAQAARDLTAEFPDIVERTGSLPVASFTSTKLRWLRDAEPENARRVAAVALPHDWLIWRMRGFGPADAALGGPQLHELTTDRSDASGTGYWNPATGDYDEQLLTASIGHAGTIVPHVLGPGASPGSVALGGPIMAVGAGDNAGAALGLGARPGDVVVSIGTSGTVFAVTEQPSREPTGTIAGFADASGNYLPLVATLNAARVLDSIADLLGVSLDELGVLALSAEPGCSGLVLQPFFEGERTPNRPDATATLFGMTLASTSRENLARAAIEGVLCGLSDGLDALIKNGVVANRIMLIGGAAQNSAVAAIAAQVFAAPVVVPRPAEYVALGAAVQAAWALTGTRPVWTMAVHAEPPVDTRPIIRAQYRARL